MKQIRIFIATLLLVQLAVLYDDESDQATFDIALQSHMKRLVIATDVVSGDYVAITLETALTTTLRLSREMK